MKIDELFEATLKVDFDGTYYSFTSKNTKYTLKKDTIRNEWELWSNRLAIKNNLPTIRFFKSLEEIEEKITGLKGLATLINDVDKSPTKH